MKNKQKLTIAATTFVLLGLATFGFFRYLPQTVKAFNPQPDPPGYGLVGITRGQTLRISVLNTNPAPTAELPPDPCRVVITFRDGNNNLFRNGDGTPIRRVVQLNGGESTSLDLDGDNFGRLVDSTVRLQLRPVVSIQQPDGNNGLPPEPVIPTAEVFNNNNGRTQFVMPALLPAVQHAAQPAT